VEVVDDLTAVVAEAMEIGLADVEEGAADLVAVVAVVVAAAAGEEAMTLVEVVGVMAEVVDPAAEDLGAVARATATPEPISANPVGKWSDSNPLRRTFTTPHRP
jgi:hypothetical protein